MKKMNKNEIGAIGIGTLIIFIALILVAAIAAAVVIRTANNLEEDAERAGEGAREDVSGGMNIQTIQGNAAAGGNIDGLRIYVNLFGGSKDLNMVGIVVHIVYTPLVGAATTLDIAHSVPYAAGDAPDADGSFSISEISDPNDAYNAAISQYVLDQDALLTIDLPDAPLTINIPPNSMVEIGLIQTSGGPLMTAEFETPSSYPTGGGPVNLDN